MTYEELKKIAQPHIRTNENLPSNAFLLLTQLHIPFKSEKQCEEDFSGKMTPLYNHPAFLANFNGEKIIYFNSNTEYWNFYIFHEIAHYILGHENDSPQNEMDADMLACILAAPYDNLPSTLKSARDLSTLCKIPIDKAEMYWREIKPIISKKHFPKWALATGSALLALVLAVSIWVMSSNKAIPANNNTYKAEKYTPTVKSEIKNDNNIDSVVVTPSGTKYHLPSCQYVKDKTNTIEYNISEAIDKGYYPCKICIK